MKKAQLTLSVTGILSVVAGTLAFKAQHRFLGTYFCTSILGATTQFSVNYTTVGTPTATLFCTKTRRSLSTLTLKVVAAT